jgi:hypothetical protein
LADSKTVASGEMIAFGYQYYHVTGTNIDKFNCGIIIYSSASSPTVANIFESTSPLSLPIV